MLMIENSAVFWSGLVCGFWIGVIFAYFFTKKAPLETSPSASGIAFYIDGEKVTGMQIMKDNQQEMFTIKAEDAKGNDTSAGFDSAPTWGVTDADMFDLQPGADGLSCAAIAKGKVGTCQLQVTASVGGKQIVGSEDLQVIPGDAVSIAIVGSAPTDQSAAAAPAPAP